MRILGLSQLLRLLLPLEAKIINESKQNETTPLGRFQKLMPTYGHITAHTLLCVPPLAFTLPFHSHSHPTAPSLLSKHIHSSLSLLTFTTIHSKGLPHRGHTLYHLPSFSKCIYTIIFIPFSFFHLLFRNFLLSSFNA